MVSARNLAAAILPAMLILAGCVTPEEWGRIFDSSDRGGQPEAEPRLASKSAAVRGTIGPLVTIDGLRLNQVRGFGLVVDLIDTGGSDAPEVVKRYLVKEIRRRQKPGMPGMPAAELLESRDTAMVEVTGFIPAAAQRGDRFDVLVRALGTQTQSLVGGRLVLCELKLFAETPHGVISGEPLAKASGPVFVPTSGMVGAPGTKIDLRVGRVLGGGITIKPRRVRLALNSPSYSTTRRMVDRINGRYSVVDPVADGLSPSLIDLHIPAKYRARKRLFLEHVVHTTLNGSLVFLKRRAQELADEITHPDAEFDSIGLAWEAIGRVILPALRPFYQHTLPATNYFSGRSGMRLGDAQGMEAVARHARDPKSPFRDEAIDELGYAVKLHGAGEYLRELLDNPDEAVRIAAYKALRRRPHPVIETRILDEDNVILDVVDCRGPYLIYVQLSTAPRIAVFGKYMRCRPPAMYPPGTQGDGRRVLTQISAGAGDDHLTIIYQNKRTGRHSPSLSGPLNVAELLRFLGDAPRRDSEGDVQALAVPYSEVVDILNTFCKTGTIPAKLIFEQPDEALTPGTDTRRERPETED